MTQDEVRAVLFGFPDVEEAFSQGSANFRVGAKSLARLGARTGPDDLMLWDIGFDESEVLIAADPAVFHTTTHFRDAKTILVRIAAVQPETLRAMLERRWRKIAPKAAVRAWDAERGEAL